MTTPQHVTAEVLGKFDPVSSLPADQVEELAAQTPVEEIPAGTRIFAKGDADNKAIFLLEGKVSLQGSSKTEIVVEAGTEDAKAALANNQPRRITAVAASNVRIIRVDKDLLDAMVVWGQLSMPEPEVIMTADGVFEVDKASWLRKMVKSPTFKNLPPANIEQLLDKLEPIKVEAGEIVIRQGDVGDYFYMIDQGTALVTRQTEDEEEESIELAELPEGASFGEAALISNNPRNATVSMMSDGILLRLSKEDFLTLLNQPNVRWIEYEQAQKRVNEKKAVWLDIRLSREFSEGHIAGAINIPVQQLHRRARDLDKSVSYICYCDSGKRSSAAMFVLKQHGLDAYVLKDGTEALPSRLMVK